MSAPINHETSYMLRRYFVIAAVVTGLISLVAQNPTPFAGCVVCAALMLPFIWWLEKSDG